MVACAWNPSTQEAEHSSCKFQATVSQKTKQNKKQNRNRFRFTAWSLHTFFFALQGKPPTKKAKVLHKAAWSAKIGAFLHAQGTGQLADGTPTGQDGEPKSCHGRLGWGWPAGKLGIQVYSEVSPPAGRCGNDRRHSFQWLSVACFLGHTEPKS